MLSIVSTAMGVRVHADQRPGLGGEPRVALREVASVRVPVDLEHRPRARRRVGDLLDVDLIRIPAVDQPAAQVADAVDKRVLDRGKHPVVIFPREMLNDVWTLAITQSTRSAARRRSRAPVGKDVHLRPGEDPEAAPARVQGPHLFDSLGEPFSAYVVSESVGRRMVGDPEVCVSARARRRGHLLERVMAVGQGRVAMQVASDVFRARPTMEGARGRRLDLAARLTELGLDVVKSQPPVDLGFARVARQLGASVSVIPCSETESPMARARSRSSTLCSAEPVKC